MVANNGDIPQFDEFRVTWLWSEVVLGPLAGDVATDSLPRPYVVDQVAYVERFAQPEDPLTVPWIAGRENGFWHEYMERRPLQEVSGLRAYKTLVPFRQGSVLNLSTPVDGVSATSEGLHHPWGVTFMVTARGTGGWPDCASLADAVDLLRQGEWKVDGDDGTATPCTLAAVGREGLKRLRVETFGEQPGRVVEAEPFSVFTAIRCSLPRADLSPKLDPVRRVLHAVASSSRTWRTDQLPDVAEMTVAGRKARPSDHVVYGTKRGRAIWAPDYLDKPGQTLHTLGCQHRNLVMASAQAESMAGLMVETAASLPARGVLKAAHQVVARRAGGQLGRAYVGQGTYRSGSLRSQISANGWLTATNAVRAAVGLDAIVP